MASFGEQLRQARESQNISLQEIAASTKISSRALQALESEHFDQLPGGIFNKGFVRAYARYVGLDEEKMLEAYMAAANEDGNDNDLQTISDQVAALHPQPESRINANVVIGIVALLVALGLSALWYREHRREIREQRAQVAAHTEAPAQAPPPAPLLNQPSTTEQPSPAAPAENAAAPSTAQASNEGQKATPAPGVTQGAPVEVSVTATQMTWISVRSDGKTVDSLLMDPDKPNLRTRTYKANENVRMVVGNAGGLEVVSNGKPVASLGKTGQTAIVTFTATGMEKR